MPRYANPGFEDDLTMDIIEADLEWVDSDSGGMIELNSKYLEMAIVEQGSLDDKYPWRLEVEARDGTETDRVFLKDGFAERDCVDLEHAEWLAEAFEREAIRRME